MNCPYCSSKNFKVVDKRDSLNSIRRRRECIDCGKRFTTYETIECSPLYVIKKDGSRRTFDKLKLKTGILKACEKRPISIDQIDLIVGKIEQQLIQKYETEVNSHKIGELVMKELKKLDKVAYIRFSSVYREFADIEEFSEIIDKLK